MGRLPALICAGASVLFGCDQGAPEPTAPKARAQAVEATAIPAAAAPAPSAASAAAPPSATPTAKPRRNLCTGQLAAKGRDLPKKAKLSRVGDPKPPPELPAGNGKWMWMNFWAAWCVPCKEEIPRLRGWHDKLGAKLDLVFVSLDDDERQLAGFIGKQPATGLKSSYWLRDGTEREEWLAEAELDVDPELPMHVLVDPKGKIRCVINGAVEDADYDRVVKIVGE